jgi:hypothetical protein
VSVLADRGDRQSAVEAVGGFLAAAGLFMGLLAMVYRPARVAPVAAVLVLAAAAMAGPRYQRLVVAGVVAVGVGWLVGMTAAVITSNPIF